MARMGTQVEELADNRVRLQVEVEPGDVRHAVEHAASDLAESMKIPGFRKGHVPMPVLLARVGRDRLYAEAVESHIGGWFRAALRATNVRPVETPEYGYELPSSPSDPFEFTATVAVQPKPEVADWTTLEVPAADAEVPDELVDLELERVRETVAELTPVDGRPVQPGDTVVLDVEGEGVPSQLDYVAAVGEGRLVEEIEDALVGMAAGETKSVGIP